ncbi:MAG: hypothetical protein ACRD3B_12390 [Candidatus Sulfotelmatobacter sp.]
MTRKQQALLQGAVVAILTLPGFAKTPTLNGKMVAYDPILHAGKPASTVANREEIILEAPGHKAKYVKLVFVSVGTTQLDAKYFDGTLPLTVQALRDRTCDESTPRFVKQVGLDQRAGTYLLTNAFKNSPPARIKTLECYEATRKK